MRTLNLFFLSLFLLITSWLPAQEVHAFVSIAPLQTFVERIGGERVSVEVLVGPAQSPATYEPTPRQMAQLSEAEVLFRVGVPFENALVPRFKTMSNLRIVDLREEIALRHIEEHSHGDEGHDHEYGNDPHTWLSPKLVLLQAVTIHDALVELDPEGREVYGKNLGQLTADLVELHLKLQETLAPVRGNTMLVFHPSWGYFADVYGLKQVAIERGGKEPSAKHMTQIIEEAKKSSSKTIFVQPQFNRSLPENVARMVEGNVVEIDPLATDYFANMGKVAQDVRAAFIGVEVKKP